MTDPLRPTTLGPHRLTRRGLLLFSFVAFSIVVGCARHDETGERSPVDEGRLSSDKQEERSSAAVQFTEIAPARGIELVSAAFGAEDHFFPAIMGPGAALLDFDRDGALDIFVVNGAPIPRLGAVAAPRWGDRPATVGQRLYRQGADGQFTDVTAGSGLDLESYGMGVAVGDVNNDGYPDLYVSAYGADRLFLNRGDGTFADITEEAGIDNERWGMSVAFFDFDRDGWLDLFVTNYVDYDPARPCRGAGGERDFCNPAVFPPVADRLYRNVTGEVDRPAGGEGSALRPRFEDVSLTSGVGLKPGPGLGVLCADLTGDGWQDIFVANDGAANFLWVNQRDGTFREEAVLLGVAYDTLGRAQGSMGIALGDVNHDGREDLLVTNLEGENNALYLALPQHGYEEGSAAAGLGSSFPATGFGVCLFDVQNKGHLDLFIANGRVRRTSAASATLSGGADQQDFWSPYREANTLWLNNGDGTFKPWTGSDDPLLNPAGVSRALVMGDIDNDGDLDLLVTQSGGPVRLLRNDTPRRGHWLMIQAVDPRYGGRDAYGAVITVAAGERKLRRTLNPCSSYLGTHDPRLHFGLGEADVVETIEVLWPDGTLERFPGGPADTFRTLEFGAGERR
jgi:enediyne biosynthesis protein E4